MRALGRLAAAFALAALGGLAVPSTAARAEDACTQGQTRYVAQSPDAFGQLGVQAAWQLSKGAVLVAVVDSGVDAGNAHLAEAVVPGLDLVGSTDGTTDTFGHGTAVAGIIAARHVDGSGLLGVAPEATILPVRVYEQDNANKANPPDPAKTAQGIVAAADRGAKIIVVPQSTDTDVPALANAVEHAATAGALVVASAGNASSNNPGDAVRYPADYPQVLSVTAVDGKGQVSNGSQHGVHVEIAAPGANVLTTFFANGDCILAPQTTSSSYATAYVAGAAALVAAMYPGETPADWEYRLLATALRPAGSPQSTQLGWGIVAPYAALNFVNDGSVVGPKNPRFPPPAVKVEPIMPSPTPVPDNGPAIRGAVTGAVVGVAALLLGGLLLARILPKRRRSRKR